MNRSSLKPGDKTRRRSFSTAHGPEVNKKKHLANAQTGLEMGKMRKLLLNQSKISASQMDSGQTLCLSTPNSEKFFPMELREK